MCKYIKPVKKVELTDDYNVEDLLKDSQLLHNLLEDETRPIKLKLCYDTENDLQKKINVVEQEEDILISIDCDLYKSLLIIKRCVIITDGWIKINENEEEKSIYDITDLPDILIKHRRQFTNLPIGITDLIAILDFYLFINKRDFIISKFRDKLNEYQYEKSTISCRYESDCEWGHQYIILRDNTELERQQRQEYVRYLLKKFPHDKATNYLILKHYDLENIPYINQHIKGLLFNSRPERFWTFNDPHIEALFNDIETLPNCIIGYILILGVFDYYFNLWLEGVKIFRNDHLIKLVIELDDITALKYFYYADRHNDNYIISTIKYYIVLATRCRSVKCLESLNEMLKESKDKINELNK